MGDPSGNSENTLSGESSTVDELSGKLTSNPDEERLMRSILENDKETIKDGMLLNDATSMGVGAFTPDIIFEQLVNNFRNAKQLYGQTLIRELTEYGTDFIEKNINIPEFRDSLQQHLQTNIDRLKEKGLLDKEGRVTKLGMKLAGLVMYTEELDHLVSIGLGKKELKERDTYGEKADIVPFKKGFRFRDISLKQSVKQSLRRGHKTLIVEDLRAHEREQKGRIQIIYALDSSGSMRGEKIKMSKRAGIALAFKAIEERNEVGLMLFTKQVDLAFPPTRNFPLLLDELVKVRAGSETNITEVLLHAPTLFTRQECTKHLILLTDALTTKGKDPYKEAIEAAGTARNHGITISVIGINLEKEGESLARQIVEVGEGRLYKVSDLSALDKIMLEEYDQVNQ